MPVIPCPPGVWCVQVIGLAGMDVAVFLRLLTYGE